MNVSISVTSFLTCGLLMLSVARSPGDDLTTASGKTYKNIEVTSVGADYIVINFDSGTAKIMLGELPDKVRQRFGVEQLFAELRRKTSELAKVQAELALANQEIARLRQNRQAVLNPVSGPLASPPASPAALSNRAIPPVESLPAVRPDDIVQVEDLLAHYKNDPLGADRRYRKKTFRVQGRVERFEEKLFVRNTDVILESTERHLRAVCNLPFAEEFKAVFSKLRGQKLVGITANGEKELMRVGETIIFKGRCAGLRNSMIAFQNCERVQ